MYEKENENRKENWKIERYNDTTIEIDGKKGEFGVDKWKLKLKKGDQEIIADFGPSVSMRELSSKIRGIENYFSLLEGPQKK